MVEAVGWDHSVEEEKGRRVMESLREVFADGAMQVWPQSWVIQCQNMPQVEIMPIADIFKTFFLDAIATLTCTFVTQSL